MPPPAVSSPHRVTVSLLFCQQQALSRNPMNLPERVCCCLFFLSSGRHHLTVYPGNLSYPRASLHNTSHSCLLLTIFCLIQFRHPLSFLPSVSYTHLRAHET